MTVATDCGIALAVAPHHAGPSAADAARPAPKLADAVRGLREVESSDPRLMIILAASRIEGSLNAVLAEHASSFKVSKRFRTRINAAHTLQLIDDDLREFFDLVRWLRNRIAHDLTYAGSLSCDPFAPMVRRLCELAGGAAAPVADGYRGLRAALVAGVMAVGLSVSGADGSVTPQSFSRLRQIRQRSNRADWIEPATLAGFGSPASELEAVL